jgi:hypothetical protein
MAHTDTVNSLNESINQSIVVRRMAGRAGAAEHKEKGDSTSVAWIVLI